MVRSRPELRHFLAFANFVDMETIAQRLMHLKRELPGQVTLVAVSKTHPVPALLEAYAAGQLDFGENRVQEMVQKHLESPEDIRWHLIGTLQRNKVKAIAPFVHLIHSIDSERLLAEVDRQAMACGRVIDVLLQFHVAQEETKHGLSWEEAEHLLRSEDFASMRHVRVCGIMGMASFTEDLAQVRGEFALLRGYFDRMRATFFSERPEFSVLSMGMSGDYRLAIEEGSNMVRVGSAIFGTRPSL